MRILTSWFSLLVVLTAGAAGPAPRRAGKARAGKARADRARQSAEANHSRTRGPGAGYHGRNAARYVRHPPDRGRATA